MVCGSARSKPIPRAPAPISRRCRLGASLVAPGHDDVASIVRVGLRELAAETLRAADDDDCPCAHVGLLSRQAAPGSIRLGGPSPATTV